MSLFCYCVYSVGKENFVYSFAYSLLHIITYTYFSVWKGVLGGVLKISSQIVSIIFASNLSDTKPIK